MRHRSLQVSHNFGDLGSVSAVDPVDLLLEQVTAFGQTRIERILLLEIRQISHRDAVIQIVGACEKQILALTRGLVRHDGVHHGVEQQRFEPLHELLEGLAVVQRELRTGLSGRPDRIP